jgi:hypothetical protein
MKKIAPLFALLTLMGASEARDIAYLGTWDCGQWAEAARQRNEVMRKAYLFWLTGFLSGVAVAKDQPDMLDQVSEASIATWTDTYCSSHPMEKLITAANTLADELIARDVARSKR